MFYFLIITLSILLVCFALFFLLFPSIKRKYYKKNYLKIYGKKIYKYVDEEDFYLINKLALKASNDSILDVDHLVLGNKYLYIIHDMYVVGGIEGKEVDTSWIQYYGSLKHPSTKYIPNPMKENISNIEKFSGSTRFNKNMLIAITVVNNDCLIKKIESTSNNNYFVNIKDLPSLIDSLEARDVPPLNQTQLKYVVRDLVRSNLNRQKGNQ